MKIGEENLALSQLLHSAGCVSFTFTIMSALRKNLGWAASGRCPGTLARVIGGANSSPSACFDNDAMSRCAILANSFTILVAFYLFRHADLHRTLHPSHDLSIRLSVTTAAGCLDVDYVAHLHVGTVTALKFLN